MVRTLTLCQHAGNAASSESETQSHLLCNTTHMATRALTITQEHIVSRPLSVRGSDELRESKSKRHATSHEEATFCAKKGSSSRPIATGAFEHVCSCHVRRRCYSPLRNCHTGMVCCESYLQFLHHQTLLGRMKLLVV